MVIEIHAPVITPFKYRVKVRQNQTSSSVNPVVRGESGVRGKVLIGGGTKEKTMNVEFKNSLNWSHFLQGSDSLRSLSKTVEGIVGIAFVQLKCLNSSNHSFVCKSGCKV